MDRLTPPHPGPARSPFLSAPAERLPGGGLAGLRSFSLRAPSTTDAGSAENLVQARYELHRALDSNDPDKARAWLRDWGESLIRGADDGRAAEEAFEAHTCEEPDPDKSGVRDALKDAEDEVVSLANRLGASGDQKVSPNEMQEPLRAILEDIRDAKRELENL